MNVILKKAGDTYKQRKQGAVTEATSQGHAERHGGAGTIQTVPLRPVSPDALGREGHRAAVGDTAARNATSETNSMFTQHLPMGGLIFSNTEFISTPASSSALNKLSESLKLRTSFNWL